MPSPLEGWRLEQDRAGLLESSIYHHVGLVSAFEKFLGRDALTATREDINAWLDRRPLSAKSRYDYLSCLSTFFKWCVLEELLDVNPCDRIRRPKLRRYLPRPIPGNDLEVALRSADERMRAWLLLGAMAGCRCMEMANLDTQDIHREGEPVLLLRGKGGKERVVPLHPLVGMALDVVHPHKAGPVFTVQGKRIRPQRVSALISQFLRGLGIDATAHQLRHKFGTDVYRLSKDIRLTQELLGHASPQTTSVYAAWSPSEGRKIVSLLVSPLDDVEGAEQDQHHDEDEDEPCSVPSGHFSSTTTGPPPSPTTGWGSSPVLDRMPPTAPAAADPMAISSPGSDLSLAVR